MKKKIILGILILFSLIFIGKRVYWFCDDYTNLVIIMSNYMIPCDSNMEERIPISIELYVDNDFFYKNDSLTGLYWLAKDRIMLGKHHLKVIIDSKYVITETFYVLPMKWIVIEYWGNNSIDDIGIRFESSPPVL
ncbi:hypothetical protein [Bacteroides sp.]